MQNESTLVDHFWSTFFCLYPGAFDQKASDSQQYLKDLTQPSSISYWKIGILVLFPALLPAV